MDDERITIVAGGKTLSCRSWTVGDLIEFNELQAKLDELQAQDPRPTGKNQLAGIKLLVEYISGQTGIPVDEVKRWPQRMLLETLSGIMQANALPKAPTAAAQPAPSLESSTLATPASTV